MIGLVALFMILGLLFSVESSTSISRKAGYHINNPSSGFIFQSSLSLVSRALIFMFMPLIGYLSDRDELVSDYRSVLLLFLFIPAFLLVTKIYRLEIESFFGNILYRISENGSYLKKSSSKYLIDIRKYRSPGKFKKLYTLFFVAYVPYYLAWPVIIILLDKFNESRGLILGLSSLFNGINTIIITTLIDPKLAQLGMYNNLIMKIYDDLLLMRFYVSILSFLILAIVLCLMN